MSVRHHRKNKSTLSLPILTSYLKLSIMFHEFLYSLEKFKKYTVLFSSAFLDFYKTFLHILYEYFSYSNTNIFLCTSLGLEGLLREFILFYLLKSQTCFSFIVIKTGIFTLLYSHVQIAKIRKTIN